MIANIKNGQIAKKSLVMGSKKNICEALLKILWDEGYISGYRTSTHNAYKFEIFLKYTKTGTPVINSFKPVSKPGHRIYYSAKQIWKLTSRKTLIIFSTNKGLKSITECKKNRLGGEPLVIIN